MKVKVLELRPTQMVIGMKEVDYRISKLRDFKKGDLDDYIKSHKVPAVLGPRGRTYLVDHHHLTRAAWEIGLEEMPVEIIADLSKLSYPEWWKELDKRRWFYPYDQFGHGPVDPIHLPESVRSFADDPYRSLAWAVREKGGYLKTDRPFAEFRWANFFRTQLDVHPVHDKFDDSVKKALELARSPAAAALPGYILTTPS